MGVMNLTAQSYKLTENKNLIFYRKLIFAFFIFRPTGESSNEAKEGASRKQEANVPPMFLANFNPWF